MTLLDAIDRQDQDTLEEMLVDDVVFHSPVQTYRGRHLILPLLLAIGGDHRERRGHARAG